jgi:4-hydroxyproline epimerase
VRTSAIARAFVAAQVLCSPRSGRCRRAWSAGWEPGAWGVVPGWGLVVLGAALAVAAGCGVGPQPHPVPGAARARLARDGGTLPVRTPPDLRRSAARRRRLDAGERVAGRRAAHADRDAFFDAKRRFEERSLRARFAGYEAYRNVTRVFVPFVLLTTGAWRRHRAATLRYARIGSTLGKEHRVPSTAVTRLQVIDSHTGGEPTRVVVGGWPDLGTGSLASAAGALRCRARSPARRGGSRAAGSRRGRRRVARATRRSRGLYRRGLLQHRRYPRHVRSRHDGPADDARAPRAHRSWASSRRHTRRHGRGRAARTVASPSGTSPSYRHAAGVELDVPGLGRVVGDVAWGGNWFFLVHDHDRVDLTVANVARLTAEAWAIRRALVGAGVTGRRRRRDRPRRAHRTERMPMPAASCSAPARRTTAHPAAPAPAPHSPVGTPPVASPVGRVWRQESVVGSVFEGVIERSEHGRVWPAITGRAFVTGEATLIVDPDDPLCWGIQVDDAA